MSHKTRYARKHKKRSYRHKTQKGGYAGILFELAGSISRRLTSRVAALLSRAQASGSLSQTTHSISEVTATGGQVMTEAIQRTVQEAVAQTPALQPYVAELTRDILQSSAENIASVARAAVGANSQRMSIAIGSTISAALAIIATTLSAELGNILMTISNNPTLGRSILQTIQHRIDTLSNKERVAKATEAAASGIETGLGRALASRPSSLTAQLVGYRDPRAGLPNPFGVRGFSTQVAKRHQNEATLAKRSENEVPVTKRSQNEGEGNANNTSYKLPTETPLTSAKTFITDESVEAMSRPQLVRIFEAYTPPGTVGAAPQSAKGLKLPKLKEEVKKIASEYREWNKLKFGLENPPVPKLPGPLANITSGQLIAQAAKQQAQMAGAMPAQLAKIDYLLAMGRIESGNMFDLLFTPSPEFVTMITNPEAMKELTDTLPAVQDNGVPLATALFNTTPLGKAIKAVKLSESNVSGFYRVFGGKVIEPRLVSSYNKSVEDAMRLLLEKTPRAEIENLLSAMTPQNMESFRTAFFDYFLSSPQNAMTALNIIVRQILPNMKLTPGAMDRIVSTLESDPNDLLAVLTQIVSQRSVAQQELAFAPRLWRAKASGQTFGRFAVIGLGATAIIFLATLYGVTNPYEFMFQLRTDIQTLGVNEIITSGIDRVDRFYDAIHYAILNRNTEQAISAGILTPVSSMGSRIMSSWNTFIQAGRPRTLFDTLVHNLEPITSRVNGQYLILVGGSLVIGSMIYRARQLRIQAASAAISPGSPQSGTEPPDTNNSVPLIPDNIARSPGNGSTPAVRRRNLTGLPNLPAATENV